DPGRPFLGIASRQGHGLRVRDADAARGGRTADRASRAGTRVAPRSTEMGGALTDAVQQTVETVWATLLGLAVQRKPAPAQPDESPAWAGTVRISGAWDGEVRVTCTAELAHRAAAIMFAVERAAANVAQAE